MLRIATLVMLGSLLVPEVFAAEPEEGPADVIHTKRFHFGLRYGQVKFTGNRAFKKYNEELLGKNNPTGQVVWPEVVFTFNQSRILRPVFAIRLGIIYYWGEASRGYQSSELKVKTQGNILEHGFRIGFYPNLSWLFLYNDIGFGLPSSEKVTVSSPTGEKTFDDDMRSLTGLLSFGARVDILAKLHIEAVGTVSVFDELGDDMLTLGVGYGF